LTPLNLTIIIPFLVVSAFTLRQLYHFRDRFSECRVPGVTD
jgi:hypothetical protein